MSNQSGKGSPKARARSKTEEMRVERAAQAERARRRQMILTVVGGVVILGLIVAIVLAVVNASGGDDEAQPTNLNEDVVAPANLVDGAIPVGDQDAPVTVDLYYDYMCPACGAFEDTNEEDLTRLVEEGTAQVHLRPMNFLDQLSEGTRYSSRAGNAVATVADKSPEHVWDLHNALYANQPAEGTPGLSDEEIAELATEVGVPDDVVDAFADGTHGGWVTQSNEAAGEDGVESTPTVRINGETFEGDWSQPGVLAEAIESAADDA